jgi:uncharacterized protein
MNVSLFISFHSYVVKGERMTQRTVVWKPLEYEGIELLTLTAEADRIYIDSGVITVVHPAPFRLDYQIACDSQYRVQNVTVALRDRRPLLLTSDGRGQWFDSSRMPIPELDGCIDVDISATPFTNTLPINRIAWQPGQSEIINIAYILIPDLTVHPDQQRYTCIDKTAQGAVFQFEQLSSGFTARLVVDADGLVVDYPGLFTRVPSG